MAYSVYVILCDDGSFYTGCTKNLDSRMRLHKCGKGAKYTRMHKPKNLVYVEEFKTRGEAMKRELRVKKLSHKQKLELTKTKKTRRHHKRKRMD
jgi:putative endonuclease